MDQETATLTNDSDVPAIEGIVTALYESISGPAGAPRDWPRFRNLFLGNAILAWPVPGGAAGVTLVTMTVDQFVQTAGPDLSGAGNMERELSRRVERFNHIAHVFSTYEAQRNVAPTVSRGINSLQLFFDGQRWWITNILFDFETASAPLPDVYVQNTGGTADG